jgi:phage terminase Nu1 subunit (DNA packaging protein)
MTSGVVSTSTLSTYFGVTARTIENLTVSGVVVHTGRGEFNLKDSVRRYCEHMCKSASGRASAEATQSAKTKSLEASARLRNAQVKAAEAKLRRESGEWTETAVFEGVMGQLYGKFRRVMLGLVPQVTRSLHLAPKESDAVRDCVYSALTALAEGDPLADMDIRIEDT